MNKWKSIHKESIRNTTKLCETESNAKRIRSKEAHIHSVLVYARVHRFVLYVHIKWFAHCGSFRSLFHFIDCKLQIHHEYFAIRKSFFGEYIGVISMEFHTRNNMILTSIYCKRINWIKEIFHIANWKNTIYCDIDPSNFFLSLSQFNSIQFNSISKCIRFTVDHCVYTLFYFVCCNVFNLLFPPLLSLHL